MVALSKVCPAPVTAAGFFDSEGPVSWSISISGRSKASAIAQAERCHAPLAVKILIVDAIKGISSAFDAVMIEGQGHQADGASYDVSSCTFEVKPIVLPKD